MKQEEVIQLLEKTGALLRGHFLLTSGLHSDQYFQCARLLQYPERAEALGRGIAALFRGERITCVAGPALGGILIAYEVARALGARNVFAERQEGRMTLRRGFDVTPEDRVLIVEDVITTGGSAQEVVDLLKDKTQVVGVASIVDRSGKAPDFGVPAKSLAELTVQTFPPEDCPLCKKGTPAVKPGSRSSQAKEKK